MIFRNMERFEIQDVKSVLKIGDTISDIKEGKNAGVWSAGIIVGSSEMGLSREEYQELPNKEKEKRCQEIAKRFLNAGADKVFLTLQDLISYLS